MAKGIEPNEKWTPVDDSLIRYLKEKSSKRVSKNSDFNEIQKDLDDTKKNEGWIKVADILKRSGKDKDKRKEKKDLATTAQGRKQLWIKDPRVQESLNIMTDWLARGK
jgi:predicted nuclease of restriction endonuclease-like (RecB) superfamily